MRQFLLRCKSRQRRSTMIRPPPSERTHIRQTPIPSGNQMLPGGLRHLRIINAHTGKRFPFCRRRRERDHLRAPLAHEPPPQRMHVMIARQNSIPPNISPED